MCGPTPESLFQLGFFFKASQVTKCIAKIETHCSK